MKLGVNLALAGLLLVPTGPLVEGGAGLSGLLQEVRLNDSPVDSGREECDRGSHYLKALEMRKAVEAYTNCLKDADLSAYERIEARNNRAVACMVAGCHQVALDDLTAIIKLEPGNAQPLFMRGQLLYLSYVSGGELRSKDSLEQALQDLDAAIAIDDRRAASFAVRAGVHGELGAHEKAIEDYSVALSYEPDDRLAQVKRAKASLEIGRFDDARRDLESIIERQPDDTYALRTLSDLHEAEGDLAAALEVLDRVIAIKREAGDEKIAPVLAERAALLAKKGNLDGALSDLNAVVRSFPKSWFWLVRRAELLSRLGRHDAALTDLTLAEELRPGSAVVAYARGDVLCRRGDLELAESEWSSAHGRDRRADSKRLGLLRKEGFYDGPIKGDFDTSARSAEIAWAQASCPLN